MPLRAVVFDFDGVIANSEPLHLRAFQHVLAGAGVALTPEDYYSRYLGYDDVGVFRAVGEAAGAYWTKADIDAFVARKASSVEALVAGESILFPGAADAIRRIASTVPIAIASGALGAEIRRVLDRERLTSTFAAIVAAEDVPSGKPAPDPYVEALARINASRRDRVAAGECVAVEDSIWGLESARAAGLRAVGVTHTYPPSALAIADLVVTSLNDLTLDALARLCR